MPSSGMWRNVNLVSIHVSEESVASIFRVERNSELGTFAITTKLNHTAKKHVWFSLLVTTNVFLAR
jgi:LEA14-like dessication related protein